MKHLLRSFVVSCPALLGLTAFAGDARAESIIKSPGDHPSYHVELEPHGLLGWANLYRDNGLGLGLRATIPIVENGFVKSINNSVGIGFGLDWLRYDGCYYATGNGKSRVGYGCGASFFVIPVVMQWNFWLTTHWSVFGEPGLGFAFNQFKGRDLAHPVIDLGGRYHFNDKISLTMRIGYPSVSVGASFFL